MSHKFSTGPQLSEYVQVVRRNTNGTCLKSVSKTPTFRFFRDFQPLKRHIHTSSQMAHFDQFLAKIAKMAKIIKKALVTFFLLLQALSIWKVSEKSNERFPRKSVTDGQTNERTDERTDVTPKVSTTSWLRDQKSRTFFKKMFKKSSNLYIFD